jgi:hypothetical protein
MPCAVYGPFSRKKIIKKSKTWLQFSVCFISYTCIDVEPLGTTQSLHALCQDVVCVFSTSANVNVYVCHKPNLLELYSF